MLNSEDKRNLIEENRAVRRRRKQFVLAVGDTTGRREADNESSRCRDHIEELLKERTAELSRATEVLERERRERAKAEEKVKVLQLRVRSLIEQTSDAVFCYEYDPPIAVDCPIEDQITLLYDGVLVECNDVCAKSYGAERAEEVIGRKLTDLFGTAPGSLNRLFRALIEGGYRTIDGEGVEKLQDGSERHYLNNGHGVIEDGKLKRVWGTFRDITKRKQREQALRQSESHHRAVIENAQEGIVVVQDAKLQFVNPYVETVFGRTQEELESRPFIEFVHPEDRERIMDIHIRRFRGVEIPLCYELRVIDNRGDTRWVENNGILIEWNGRPATLNFLRDITDRKKAGQALEKSEEQYRRLVDTCPHGIQEADRDGKIVFANKAFHRIYGYEVGELMGKKVWDMPASDQERRRLHNLIWHLAREKPEPFTYCGQSLTKDGRGIDVQVDWDYVLGADGRVEGFTSIITDITDRKRTVETLRRSEIRHRELFDNMSNGVAVYEPVENGTDFVFKDVNRAAERIDRLRKEDVIGRRVTEIFPAIERFGLLDVFRRVYKTGEPENHPVSRYEDDRLTAWFGNYVYKLPSGEIVAVHDDVTERKLLDQELEKQQYYFAKAQEMGSIGTWELDIEENKLVWTDENYRTFGREVGTELTYDVFLDCVHPDDREYVDEKWKAALRNEPYDIEHRILVDDKVKWIREKADVQFDREGRPVLAIGFTQDITDRRRAQGALRESEEKFRTLAEQSPNMIFINKKGRIIYANRKCEEVMGYEREEFYGPDFDFLGLIAPESVDLVRAKFAQHLSGEEVGQYEYCLISKKGRRIEAINASRLIRYEGEPAILGVITDITERKLAEQRVLEDRTQLKSLASQLTRMEERERHRLATALHDQVGQSLVFSKLKLDQLRMSDSGGEVAEALEEVCGYLGQVIQETRTLTFDLSSPILYELGFEAAVAEWLADEIRGKHGIETEFDDDERQKPLDDDIRALLFRNVRELLINIVKHAQAHKVKVCVRRADKDVCVSVEDDGVGFDPAEVKAVAAKSNKFGLFSIRERLEQLGGRIEIDSVPGRGSRILMMAPLKCETLTDGMEQ